MEIIEGSATNQKCLQDSKILEKQEYTVNFRIIYKDEIVRSVHGTF